RGWFVATAAGVGGCWRTDCFAVHHLVHHAGYLPLSRAVPGERTRSHLLVPFAAVTEAGRHGNPGSRNPVRHFSSQRRKGAKEELFLCAFAPLRLCEETSKRYLAYETIFGVETQNPSHSNNTSSEIQSRSPTTT